MLTTYSDEKFRILFDHSSDAHAIFDGHGITDCNDAMVRILKAGGKSEVLSLHPAALSPKFQPDGRLSSEKSAEMDAIARAKGFHRFEWIHRRLNGEVFPVEVTLNAVEIDGKPAWIAVWHDLTEIKTKEDHLVRYQNRMRSELQIASDIQKSLLPDKSPFLKGLKTSWIFEPCDELGGDSLNVFALDESHVGLYVLDVAGHGVPAALLSVSVSHLLSPYSEHSFLRGAQGKKIQDSTILCPHEVLERLNSQFSSYPAFTQFVTIVYGIVDVRTFELAYASAGHTPIAYLSSGTTRFLRSGGPPIGITPGQSYPVERVRLNKGDRVLLYSDGVTEARTSKGDLFGEDRLRAMLESARKDPLERALSKTLSAIKSCLPESRLSDDVTMLGLEVNA